MSNNMRPFLIPLLLLGWPLAEITGFVLVGRAIGVWSTLGLVIGSAVLGGILLRSQGTHLLRQISLEGREGRVPGRALVDGAMIVVAGILLLLPGFITDILGLLLFIPFVRNAIWAAVGKRIVVVQPGTSGAVRTETRGPQSDRGAGGPVIDLTNQDFSRERNPSSPWVNRGPNDR